jgi:hypothetical protein
MWSFYPESIELEYQAFLPSYDLAPLPPPPPPSPVSKLSLFLSLPVSRGSTLLKREREGKRVGEEPNHTTAREPGPLYYVKYSLLLTMLPDWKERNARDNVPKVFVVVEGVSNHELVRDLETDIVRDVTRAQGSSFPIKKRLPFFSNSFKNVFHYGRDFDKLFLLRGVINFFLRIVSLSASLMLFIFSQLLKIWIPFPKKAGHTHTLRIVLPENNFEFISY